MERSTGPLLAHPKPPLPSVQSTAVRKSSRPGLALSIATPEHRSYSDRGSQELRIRGRGDGHTGGQRPGRNWGCDRRRAAAAGDGTGTSSSPRRLRGAADRAKVASGGAGSVSAALQSAVLHLLPAVRKRKEGGGVSPGPGRENLERLQQRFWPRLRAGAQGILITRLDRPQSASLTP